MPPLRPGARSAPLAPGRTGPHPLRMRLRLHAAALVAFAATAGGSTRLTAQQPIDSAYTREIHALTPTDPHWSFSTELVDYLPASPTVPTPLKVLGYVPGTVGRLSHVADVNRYFRALAAASPRVRVFGAGMSDEGREMLVVAIADEPTIAALDDYRAKLARLADPRGLARLLAHRVHPLARDREPGDVDGARLSPRRRRVRADPGHPRRGDHAHHTRPGDRRPGSRGGRLRRVPGAQRR